MLKRFISPDTYHFKSFIIVSGLLLLWTALHSVGIMYGTQDLPLHQSYIGDEQAPVNGALHILEDKSLLAVHNLKTLYYGPILSIFALPAVIVDFGTRYLSGGVGGAEDYKNTILWDWGGIVLGLRITATLVSVLALIFVYKLFMLNSVNVKKNRTTALVGMLLVALNYYFFVYSHFFKHWTFVVAFLLGQLYYGLLIRETNGNKNVYWWLHGLLTVLSFGLSYLSAVYMIAFLPLAFLLWKKNETGIRKKMYVYTSGVLLSSLAVIWWHPYAFKRYLGFLGIGDVKVGELGEAYNPVASAVSSWNYYLTEIVVNNAPLVLASLVLLFALHKSGGLKKHFYWMWMLGSVALINLLAFAPSAHHEGRYMLPTIVMLVLFVGIAFSHYMHHVEKKTNVLVLIGLLIFLYISFHAVHIGRWMYIYAQGPIEKAMLKEVLAIQKPDSPVLLVQSYIAGHVHTKEAYQAYMQKRGREDMNLYKAIMDAPLPQNIPVLNARYLFSDEYEEKPFLIDEYEVVYLYHVPRPEELNLFDYMDENLLRLWYWDDLTPSYIRLK
jgi:hypothetical protein